MINKQREHLNKIQDRKLDTAYCIKYVLQGVTLLARIGLQLSQINASACASVQPSEREKKTCAVTLINLIDWIGWATEYFIFVAGACPLRGYADAWCVGAIIDVIASGTSVV